MRRAQFIESLQREFEGHPLRERFLEELEDHMDDVEEAGEDFDSQEVEKRMGIPNQIKRQFMAILDPWWTLFSIAEAVMLISVSVLFYGGLSVFFGDFKILWWTSFIFPVVFLYSLYLASVHFRSVIQISRLKKWVAMGVILFPGFIVFIKLLLLGRESYGLNSNQIFLVVLFYTLGNVFLIRMAHLIINLSHRPLVRLSISFYGPFIFLVVGRTLLTYVSLDWLSEYHFLSYLFSPIFFFDQGVDMIWSVVRSGSPITLYIPLAIASFALIHTAISLVRDKRFNTDRGVFFLYIFSLFFLNPNSFITPPQFSAPSVHISGLIERKQLNIFYPFFKYSALDKGWNFISNLELKPESNTLFHYQVEAYKEGFILKNDLDQSFYLTPNHPELDLKQLDHKNLFQKIALTDDLDFSNTIQTSFEEIPSGYELKDSALSTDQKWWLVVISHESLGSDEVYLIQKESP